MCDDDDESCQLPSPSYASSECSEVTLVDSDEEAVEDYSFLGRIKWMMAGGWHENEEKDTAHSNVRPELQAHASESRQGSEENDSETACSCIDEVCDCLNLAGSSSVDSKDNRCIDIIEDKIEVENEDKDEENDIQAGAKSGEKDHDQNDDAACGQTLSANTTSTLNRSLARKVNLKLDLGNLSATQQAQKQFDGLYNSRGSDDVEYKSSGDGTAYADCTAVTATSSTPEEDEKDVKGQSENEDERDASPQWDSNMATTMNRAIRVFNLNPLRGIELVQRKGLVHRIRGDEEGNARRSAIFMRHTRGLNKEQIGKVLGSERPEHVRMLHNYLDLFDFSSAGPTIEGLETSLREVFSCFKPPGEAQMIERIVEAFAEKFNEDNKMKNGERPENGEFHGSTSMVLSYSIILLNVDLHNPNNPRRMTKRNFVSNLRGLDEGGDLPENSLIALYERILRSEIRHKVDRDELAGNLFTQPDKCGWLHKKGSSRLAKWKPRWFILSENTLYYFRHSEDVEFLGFIPLENVLIRTCFDTRDSERLSTLGEMDVDMQNYTSGLGSGGIFDPLQRKQFLPGTEKAEITSPSTAPLFRTSVSEPRRLPTRMRPFQSLHRRSQTTADVKKAQSDNLSDLHKRHIKSFWFELYSCDKRLGVKSGRMTKNGVRPGNRRTIKLKASSRQEMQEWVELLNQNNRFSLSELALRARVQSPQYAVPSSPLSTSTLNSSGGNSSKSSARQFFHNLISRQRHSHSIPASIPMIVSLEDTNDSLLNH